MAEEANLDLVEISPDAKPPVCKILDYGKFKFQEQKKAAEARKKQKVIEIKEIKMRPKIDDHDYDVKMRAIRRFFEEGDKVKITLRFRGREMAHQELGMKLLDRVKEDTARSPRSNRSPARRPPDHDGPRAEVGRVLAVTCPRLGSGLSGGVAADKKDRLASPKVTERWSGPPRLLLRPFLLYQATFKPPGL